MGKKDQQTGDDTQVIDKAQQDQTAQNAEETLANEIEQIEEGAADDGNGDDDDDDGEGADDSTL
jgi:hypothetical protein